MTSLPQKQFVLAADCSQIPHPGKSSKNEQEVIIRLQSVFMPHAIASHSKKEDRRVAWRFQLRIRALKRETKVVKT
jgi:hypothetical protein